MCRECRMTVCPDGCPGNEGYSAERGRVIIKCSFCGRGLYAGDEYTADGEGGAICSECAEGMDIHEILRICEFKNTNELLRELGHNKHAC